MSRQCKCGGVIRQHELIDNRTAWTCGDCGRYEVMSMSREQLRDAMPTVASVVDEYRHLMANGGKLIYASENGHVIDRREPVNPDQVFDIPAGYRLPAKEKK